MDLSNFSVDPQSELGCATWKVDAVKQAIREGILSEDHPLILFYNLDEYR